MPKIAVLCPGHSLTTNWTASSRVAGGFELVIAVNRAGWLFEHDWLACGDDHVVEPIRNRIVAGPRVGYITHVRMEIPTGSQRREPPLYKIPKGDMPTECGWTFPNALMFACNEAAGDEICVYGFDCLNQPDIAQVILSPSPNGALNIKQGCHTQARWLAELPWVKYCWSFGRVCAVGSEAHPVILQWLNSGLPWSAVIDILNPHG